MSTKNQFLAHLENHGVDSERTARVDEHRQEELVRFLRDAFGNQLFLVTVAANRRHVLWQPCRFLALQSGIKQPDNQQKVFAYLQRQII